MIIFEPKVGTLCQYTKLAQRTNKLIVLIVNCFLIHLSNVDDISIFTGMHTKRRQALKAENAGKRGETNKRKI